MLDPSATEFGLSYEHTRLGDAAVLDLRGEIDLATGEDLTAQLGRALAAVPELLVIDLTGVDFLGSAGLAALIAARDDAGGRVRRSVWCATG